MMDHEGINQVPVSQEQVKELTEMVRELLKERELNIEPEDPYVTTRIPLTDLAVYPELTEALPSIEEDFYRTPLTEEERKEVIHSCPKSSSMNYLPPPLNDSESTAVKKADTTLNGIKVALAQETRITTYDQHIVFANTMGVLLADIASKGHTRKTGKPSQGNGTSWKSWRLILPARSLKNAPESESPFVGASRLVSKTAPTAKLLRRKPLKLYIHPSLTKTTRSNQIFTGEDADDERGTQTSPGLEEIESSCRNEEFQNGNADFNIQVGSEEGLYEITRPNGCIHAYPNPQDVQEVSSILVERQILPVPRAPVWTVTQPPHFHQGLKTSFDMGLITGYASLGVPRQPVSFRRIQGDMQHEHQQSLIQVARAGVKNQGREIFDHTETSYHAFRNANQHPENDAESSHFQVQGPALGGLKVI
ncbi:hypothetical protein AYI69_g6423 [Smittium culicis]|uniref:Uncharacterized protein n=1 Tax=Smittium culicis TaxID=133412 RepID=A0A1R1XZ23_9FUNG|nr:hypothetical protein AYI69_g6423 [Smittium culicis]